MSTLRETMKSFCTDWLDDVDPAWQTILSQVQPDFESISTDLTMSGETVFPRRRKDPDPRAPQGSHVFRALDGLAPDDVRAVIIGQDPYTKIGQATGRAFEQGDAQDWSNISPSLKRVLQVLADYRVPDQGYRDSGAKWSDLQTKLESGEMPIPLPGELFNWWQSQGVLCLNAGLTFTKYDKKEGEKIGVTQAAHIALWRPIVQAILTAVATRSGKQVVFLLWGGFAKEVFKNLGIMEQMNANGPQDRVDFAEASHPNATDNWGTSLFLHSPNVFIEANARLEAMEATPIDWAGTVRVR